MTLTTPYLWTPSSGPSPVTVTGEMPSWLSGHLVRTAPAIFERGAWQAEHWFDGLCLLYGFELRQGHVGFRQQLLASKVEADSRLGKRERLSFGSSVKRSFFKRLFNPIAESTDNANVNVVPWRGGFLAMTESPSQHLIDAATLVTKGVVVHEGFQKLNSITAHPHLDVARRAMVNVGAAYGRTSQLVVFRETEDGRRIEEGRVEVDRSPYIHTFGFSERFVTVVDQPLRFNAVKMLWSNKPVRSHYEWQPETGTRFRVLDRRDGSWRLWEAPTLFVFHIANQFEDGDCLVLDLVEYADPSVIDALTMDRLGAGHPIPNTSLVRYRLDPARKTAVREPVGDVRFELPTINARAHDGRPYRYAWGTFGGEGFDAVIKLDLQTGTPVQTKDDAFLNGEALFVPRPGSTAEDDGVVLTVGVHRDGTRSALTVLDAATLELRARAEVALALPMGFHGSFTHAGQST